MILLNFFASSLIRIRIRIRNWIRTQMHNSEFIYPDLGGQLIILLLHEPIHDLVCIILAHNWRIQLYTWYHVIKIPSKRKAESLKIHFFVLRCSCSREKY
jgi:hypothetical protein